MALPFSFSNNTTPTGAQLDADLAALGALTPIPCTVSGTNALVLTPAANCPVINAYANYLQVSGVAVAANTAATTARVGSLPALPVYQTVVGGPLQATGGDLQAGSAFTLMYNSALNSGNGGWHLFSNAYLQLGTRNIATGYNVFGSLSVTQLASLTSTISRFFSTTASVTFTVVP